MTPAVMNGAVFSGNVQAADISATILDLVRKGYLTISPVQIPQKGIFGREKAPEDSLPADADQGHKKCSAPEPRKTTFWSSSAMSAMEASPSMISRTSPACSAEAKRFNENREKWQERVMDVATPKRKTYRSKDNKKAVAFAALALVANIFLVIAVVFFGAMSGNFTADNRSRRFGCGFQLHPAYGSGGQADHDCGR